MLEGAFALLESLDRAGEAGLTALAADTGLPKTSAHRLLEQLVALDAVERSGGHYRMGARVFRLGRNWQPYPGLLTAAQGPLRRLARSQGMSMALTVLREGRTIVVAGSGPDTRTDDAPVLVRPGTTWPWRTAAGMVLAAHAMAVPGAPPEPPEGLPERFPDRTQDRPAESAPDQAQAPAPEPAPDSAPDRPAGSVPWHRTARGIRERGVAFDRDALAPGVRGVAVPVPGPRGEVIAAVCALVPAGRDPAPLADPLTRTARAVRDELRRPAHRAPVPPVLQQG